MNQNSGGKGPSSNKNMMGIVSIILWALVITLMVNFLYTSMSTSKSTKISYSEFLQMVREDKVERVLLESNKYTIYPKGEKRPSASTPQETSQPEVTPIPGLENLEEVAGAVRSERGDGDTYYCAPIADDRLLDILDEHGVGYEAPYIEQLSPIIEFLLTWILPTVLMMVLLSFLFRNMSSKMGGGLGGVGKANAKVYVEKSTGVTFKDVAGQDEAKESMVEIIDILHNPQKYTEIGAKLPKGALLVGPPGTGKTLLAKAVAGEANVPFFSISGSDFVEMFVGVGASRVRDLFDKAKKNHPCIIFIDEIDAVGRQRGAGLGGGHDEREQTLNQLLVEMDGFGANEGVIMIAATNRPDILDPALMRPGRFDRQVMVGYPDIKGREEILRVHAKGKPLAPDVVLSTIAKSTAGFTGADLENLLNEAALLAARKNHRAITMEEIEEATIKVVVGTEKKSRVMSEKEKKLTAYHEAGHAIATYYCKTQDPVHQISIIPRGMAGGYTMHLPTEDRSYKSRDEMREELVVLLGGRVAEALVLDDISTGASNDIERATKIARAMVTKYGMSEKLGPITYGSDDSNPFLGKEMGHISNYSEQTASEIDEEIQSIISTAYQKTEKILTDHIDELHRLAGVLYEKEKIDGVEFQQVMDGNLLPSGMAAQALGQEPQAALPEDGAQPQEGGSASQQDQD